MPKPSRPALLLAVLLLSQGCSTPPAGVPGKDGSPDLHSPAPDQSTELELDLPRSRPDGGDTLGGPCESDVDCTSGQLCDATFPEGMCTRACATDNDCGTGERWGCRDGRCHARCNPRAILNPCRDKLVCRIDGARAFCVADCRVQACAAQGWTCDAVSGLCVDPAGGTIGAPCGVKTGACDGTPNGVCFSVNPLTDGFCTIPCSPFTKPCPLSLKDAECLLGPAEEPYCAFLCDPTAPSCPHPELSCKSAGDVDVCLP